MKINKQLFCFVGFFVFLSLCNLSTTGQVRGEMSPKQKEKIERLNEVALLYTSSNREVEAAEIYTQIGFVFWKEGLLRYAADNFLIAAKTFFAYKKYEDAKSIYSNIGVIYTDLEELENALKYFKISLNVRKKIGDKSGISSGLIDVAYILQVLEFNDDAIENLENALSLAIEENNVRLIYDCYQMLAYNYKKIGNLKKAEELINKAESFKKFLSEESKKEEFTAEVMSSQQKVARSEEERRLASQLYTLQQQITQREKDSLNFSLKAKQDSLMVAEEKAKQRQQALKLLEQEQELDRMKLKEQEAKQEKQSLLIILVIGALLFTLILLAIMKKVNNQRKKANSQLEKHNREIDEKNAQLEGAFEKIAHQNQNITQSINYAKNIQQALLPKAKRLNEIVKNAFILFKPRDVVSGDFYWFRKLIDKKTQSEKIIISAIDCTGHGVPGAFMSMIGYNLFDEIVDKGITEPSLILKSMSDGVRFTLKQDETNNQDGMDMTVCVVDIEKKIVEFAGANNPLIYIQNNEVQQIKGNPFGIGGKNSKTDFKTHIIKINQPTSFYIFSDGFIDQFGGENGKKFMIKNFREYLFSISKKDMQGQRLLLKQKLRDWMGTKYEQIDDILVIGFQI